ncbi:MAG: hypothetical protein WA857_08000 [Candidatus Acidiferrum sp.]
MATQIHFKASAGQVWRNMGFFEEVSGKPPMLLRALLPRPVRTAGDKTLVGSIVRCEYAEGELIKRITQVETARSLQFEVVKQRLGIEECVEALGGSYEIRSRGEETDIKLITNYRAHLRPRLLWRNLEGLLIGQVHRHILRGLSKTIQRENQRSVVPLLAEVPGERASRGSLDCTVSPSPSRRSS